MLWKRIRLYVLLIGIAGLLLYIQISADEYSRNLLECKLEYAMSQYKTGEIPAIDFSSLTGFSWDRLYIFGPYSHPKVIDSTIGTFWLSSRLTQIRTNEAIVLYVFTKNGHVVQHLETYRGAPDFAEADNRLGYSIEEARFIEDERGKISTWLNEEE
jgi:hypothetical protein